MLSLELQCIPPTWHTGKLPDQTAREYRYVASDRNKSLVTNRLTVYVRAMADGWPCRILLQAQGPILTLNLKSIYVRVLPFNPKEVLLHRECVVRSLLPWPYKLLLLGHTNVVTVGGCFTAFIVLREESCASRQCLRPYNQARSAERQPKGRSISALKE